MTLHSDAAFQPANLPHGTAEAAPPSSRRSGLTATPADTAISHPLLARAFAPFRPVADAWAELGAAVDTLASFGGRDAAGPARKLKRSLKRAEPSVTMIGQVKAGKTSLINAMVGMPGLLPADVNPWTSVVTSLHLSPQPAPDAAQAVFRFFEKDQWERLMQKGGRIGELAGRAGADEEYQKISGQLRAMRDKSMRRLDRQFELLMGQEHRYAHIDPELVERYVCLGDDLPEGESSGSGPGNDQGRYADITKSADLWLQRPDCPVPLCLRDTPGVNDTFLMREQVTIQAIRESRLCVVVLSAHQALSTVDLALIRLIANMPARDVLIFVNRIDELSEPGSHVTEIETSIRKTIEDHRGPVDAEIVFGSAEWATHAMAGTLDQMDAASTEALMSWSEAECGDVPMAEDGSLDPERVWDLSGVTGLYAALADRVSVTESADLCDEVARGALNLATQVETQRVRPRPTGLGNRAPLDRATLLPEIDAIEARLAERLEADFARIIAEFEQRLVRAKAGFVDRAVAALARHLEEDSAATAWTYDPTGLRILLRSAFNVYAARARSSSEKVLREAAVEICGLYIRGFDVDTQTFTLAEPAAPALKPPVFLGETIALDLSAGWWSRWWQRRRGAEAQAAQMTDVIEGECERMVAALRAEYGATDLERARAALADFVGAQRKTLVDLWMRDDVAAEEVAERVAGPGKQGLGDALAQARATLTPYVTSHTANTEAA